MSTEFQKKKSEHYIQKVESNRILAKIFAPYVISTKFMGVFPLQIHKNGSASCKLLSYPCLYSVVFFALFISDSLIFIPMYTCTFTGLDYLNSIAESVFGLVQYLSSLITLLLVPHICPKLVKFWNNLQNVITELALNGYSCMFIVTYKMSRGIIKFWLLSVLMFGLSTLYHLNSRIQLYWESSSGIMYWIMLCTFTTFSTMMCCHVLHSMMFITFVCAMRRCFLATAEQGKEVFPIPTHNVEKKKFLETLETYEKLNELVVELGNIYGFYMIIQMIAMMTSTTTNIFFLLSTKHRGLFTSIGAVLSYVCWLFYICNCGETLRSEASNCRKSLRKSAVKFEIPENLLVEKLYDPPECLTACGYFVINKQLFTSVIGTITTYLVVLLQFKMSVPLDYLHGTANKTIEEVKSFNYSENSEYERSTLSSSESEESPYSWT